MKVVLISNAQEHSGESDSMFYNKYGPILLKIMKYYADFGYKDFVLCLGVHGSVVKNYFLNFKNFTPVDFVLTSGSVINLLGTDIDDWNIMFGANGGLSNKPRHVSELQKYFGDDNYFLVNDDITIPEGPLDEFISQFKKSNKSAMRFGNSSFIFRKSALESVHQEQKLSIKTFSQLEKKMQKTNSGAKRGNMWVYL